jgi:hypothetical protein
VRLLLSPYQVRTEQRDRCNCCVQLAGELSPPPTHSAVDVCPHPIDMHMLTSALGRFLQASRAQCSADAIRKSKSSVWARISGTASTESSHTHRVQMEAELFNACMVAAKHKCRIHAGSFCEQAFRLEDVCEAEDKSKKTGAPHLLLALPYHRRSTVLPSLLWACIFWSVRVLSMPIHDVSHLPHLCDLYNRCNLHTSPNNMLAGRWKGQRGAK